MPTPFQDLPTQPEMPLPSGRAPVFVGRYQAERVLGRGQMGEVLQVRDLRSSQHLALKRIPAELVRDTSVFEGVRENFELVRGLDHPHIAAARALEVDRTTGEAFVLLDLVQGMDLSAWLILRRRQLGDSAAPLPVDEALGIAEQIAAALDFAHARPARGRARGVLHRDLKPANVMVESAREFRPGVPWVKLVDFGLAAEIQASLLSLSRHEPTHRGAGTPAYMAPEQWEGRTLTRGVDQWALAVMLYEMLAGRRPFVAHDPNVLRYQVLGVTPEAPEGMGPEAWAALGRGLARERRERHRSCLALVHAVADADPATLGSVHSALVPMPEEFADAAVSPPGAGRESPPVRSSGAKAPVRPRVEPAHPVKPVAPPAPRPWRRVTNAALILVLGLAWGGGLLYLRTPITEPPPDNGTAPIPVDPHVPDNAPIEDLPPEHPPIEDPPSDSGPGVDVQPEPEQAGRMVELSATSTTRVMEVMAAEGDWLEESAVVLRCEAYPDAAEPLHAQARHDQAKAVYEERLKELQRVKTLAEQGLATSYDVAKAEEAVSQARTEMALAQAEILAAAFAKSDLEVKMPFAGKVVGIHVQVGEMVEANRRLVTVQEHAVEEGDEGEK